MGGVILISNFYFGFNLQFHNCIFTNNVGQFGGVGFFIHMVETKIFINFENCTFLDNYASKSTTYLGVDYSQGGCFVGPFLQVNSTMNITNSIIARSYAPRGFFLFF